MVNKQLKLEDVLDNDVQTFAYFENINKDSSNYINHEDFRKNIALDYCNYRKQKENLSDVKFKEILDATLKTYLAESDPMAFTTNIDRPVKLLLEDSYLTLENHVQTNFAGILEKVHPVNLRQMLQGLKPAKGTPYKDMAKAHEEVAEITKINSEPDETREESKKNYARKLFSLAFGPQVELGLFGKAKEPRVPSRGCLDDIYRMMVDGIYSDFADKFKDKTQTAGYMNEVIKDLQPEQKAQVYTNLASVYVGVTKQEKAAKKK